MGNHAPTCPHCGCPNNALTVATAAHVNSDTRTTLVPAVRRDRAVGASSRKETATRTRVLIGIGITTGVLAAGALIANQVAGITGISGEKASAVVAKRLKAQGATSFRVTCPTLIVAVGYTFVCPVQSASGASAGNARVVVTSKSGGLTVDLGSVNTDLL